MRSPALTGLDGQADRLVHRHLPRALDVPSDQQTSFTRVQGGDGGIELDVGHRRRGLLDVISLRVEDFVHAAERRALSVAAGQVGLARGLVVAQALPSGVPQAPTRVFAELDIAHQPGRDPVGALRVPGRRRRGQGTRRPLQLRELIPQGPSTGAAESGAHVPDVDQTAVIVVRPE